MKIVLIFLTLLRYEHNWIQLMPTTYLQAIFQWNIFNQESLLLIELIHKNHSLQSASALKFKISQQKQYKKCRLFSWLGGSLFYLSLRADAIIYMSHSSHSVYITCRSGPNLEPSQRIQGSHGILHLLKESSSDGLQILLVKLRQWSAHSLQLWCQNMQGKVFRSNCEGSSLRSPRLLVKSQNIWEKGYWSTCRTITRLAQDSCSEYTQTWESRVQ